MSRMGVLGLVLLSFALALACFQIWTYRTALDNAGAFVGEFPDNMPAIEKLVNHTNAKLFIVADFCAYGQFSSPAISERYQEEIKTLRKNGVRVELHVYEPKLGDSVTAEQFDLADPTSAPEKYKTLRRNNLFPAYFEYHKQHKDPKSIPDGYTQFVQLMNGEQTRCIEDFQGAGIEVHTDVLQRLPVFMWVKDDSEAIFSIYNLGHDSREISEDTKNNHIIRLLEDIASKSLQVH
jgi:hypothetical protein